jgi:hypothetical protein
MAMTEALTIMYLMAVIFVTSVKSMMFVGSTV